MTRVVLEVGGTWTFASAVDWPGWCRRGKGEQAALEALLGHAERYALVAGEQPDLELHVVERHPGTATTDFGAPDAVAALEAEPVDARQLDLLQACWTAFDAVAAAAPAELRKGPRGGGRDRDKVVDHVREAERSYARKVGAAVPPRTLWPEQRAAITAALHEAQPGGWPARYFVRRTAWHVLDHAWEVEDRS